MMENVFKGEYENTQRMLFNAYKRIDELQKELSKEQSYSEYLRNEKIRYYKEKEELISDYEYVKDAIYTEHITMNHPDMNGFEQGQIKGLIKAAKILRERFEEESSCT